MWNEIGVAFQIMAKGMFGIFAAIILVMLAVMVMQQLGKKRK